MFCLEGSIVTTSKTTAAAAAATTTTAAAATTTTTATSLAADCSHSSIHIPPKNIPKSLAVTKLPAIRQRVRYFCLHYTHQTHVDGDQKLPDVTEARNLL
jgi:hypothetical protein